MASNRKLLVLPGDGIGPEVVGQVLRVVTGLALNGLYRLTCRRDWLVERHMMHTGHH